MSNISQGVKADSTEVCSEVAPEIVQETVRPQELTESSEAIDRERHVHHHQHRVQPVEDQRTLPTQHINSTAQAITREHKEEMLPEHQQKLHEQRTMHQNMQSQRDVERSSANLGQHVNQHEHHHIHETVQPVIQRETVQPTVVHQTVGIHEKIHDAPIVHEATTLPTINAAEFLSQKKAGGPLSHTDKGHTHQFYEGAPRVGGGGNHQQQGQANSTLDLTTVINGTGAPGIYNSSTTPDGLYGEYNWCAMPHVRKTEYQVPSSDYQLQYVEIIQRHHKRTPYASNTFFVEDIPWDCTGEGPYAYAKDRSVFNTTPIYWQAEVNTLNPFEYTVGPGFINSTCQFPAITSAGLEDAMVHGQDVQGVYGQLLQFLPLGSETQKYQWRVTNNVITTQTL
ncbi:MAG: hypothetical protein TREMPRED_001655, partial [Tremellales sp. Tagirdzhanova-0007]